MDIYHVFLSRNGIKIVTEYTVNVHKSTVSLDSVIFLRQDYITR